MKKSGLFDRNNIEFTDGCKIKTIGWDTHRIFTIVWDKKEAKFQPISEDGLSISSMSTMVRDAIVISSSIQEKYDELCKEITRLQEKYDENGYDCSPMIKLQRIEQHVDMAIDIYIP